MDTMNLVQDTLSDSRSIFERIRIELLQAKSEILVAMAWFTDNDLFEVLQDRLAQHVKVSLIISEQAENEKLDFVALQKKGAEVVKVKNVGWGMMNQKFCVIDRTVAITGSYNWTINAKNNNHETVVVTNFPKTVEELVRTFSNIKERVKRINNGETLEEIVKGESATRVITIDSETTTMRTPQSKTTANFYERSLKEYIDVLDHIVSTEVGAFDRELLKQSGYNRAMENNGDHQILSQAMDSLYSSFINGIEVAEEKKRRILARLEEQRKISSANVEVKTENEIFNLKENALLDSRNLDDEVLRMSAEIETKRHLIKSNQETKIPFITEKIDTLREKVGQLRSEFVKPPINWPASITLCSMTLLLALYIFVFYSSVAYIFIFSKEDIRTMLLSGAPIIEVPEVFNPHAISKIWSKGGGGILFLFLFVSIPLALGMYKVFLNSAGRVVDDNDIETNKANRAGKFFMKNLGLILIFVVDIFIAYKVAININDIEFLTGDVDTKLQFQDLLTNSNFWLVFALGGLGVYLFSFFFEKFFKSLIDRTSTHHHHKVKHEILVLECMMEEHLTAINELKLMNNEVESEINRLTTTKQEITRRIQQNPIHENTKIHILQQQLLSYKERIGNIGNIYISQIENERVPISKAELENRVNIFMEGWSKFLYQDYAVLRAETKTREAIHECESWLSRLKLRAHLTTDVPENLISLQN